MRKTMILVMALSVMAVLLIPGAGGAAVQGQCSNCHTMHNSQNGASMRQGLAPNVGAGASGGAECLVCHGDSRGGLLTYDCIGCHAKSLAGSNIDNNTPQVVYSTGATTLAAGNFGWVAFGDDTKGHNVHGFEDTIFVNPADAFNNNVPPGYLAAYDPSGSALSLGTARGTNLMCAGTNGCHGNRTELNAIRSIAGAHHTDDSMLKFGGGFSEAAQGSSVGTSYRFLYKIKGGEDSDWQDSVSASDHNEYKGKTFAARETQTYAGMTGTISEFCSECHGEFHRGGGITGGSGSPWLRHPTDVALPSSGEYTAYTSYNINNPVARVTLPSAASSSVVAGTDIVMCLSCHRAHAAEFDDSLRWDYQGMVLGDGTGCYVCHTSK